MVTDTTCDSDPVLRAARGADIEWLVRLRKQTMTPHLEAAGERLSDEQHRRRVLDHFGAIRIIMLGGHAVGMLKVLRGADEWRIVQLQLSAQHQRRGIGTAVLDALLREAGRRQVSVALSVLEGNPARRLYARLGFAVTAETDGAYVMRFDP